MAESRNLPARTRTRIKQEERQYLEEVVDLVRAAQREGSVHRDVDPWVLTQLLFGMMGSLVRWYRPSGKVGPAEIHASIERLVFVKA